MDRREFTGHLVAGAAFAGKALAVGAGAGSVALTFGGCNVLSELETWVPVGLSAFDTLITYINPVAGSALSLIVTTVNGLWTAVATAIANYQHTTDPTTTLLDKIIAALDALDGGLSQILSSLPASLSSAVLHAVQFGFNLLLSTLKSIQASLPPASNPTQKLTLKPVTFNTVASAKSTQDFIAQFNTKVCVAAGYSARLR